MTGKLSGRDLTIAVCAKNAAGVIAPCLESIKQQSVKPKEFIVTVDDSKDATIQVAKKLGAKVTVSKKPKLYNQRNATLQACRTKILAFTDSDCLLDKDWAKNILRAFNEHSEIAAGTGRHPPREKYTIGSWLHHMWYVIETMKTGYCDGVVGGNSYFRAEALRKVNGWPEVVAANAEDVVISQKLSDAGFKIWFDESIIAYHSYQKSFFGIVKTAVRMGYGMAKMLQREKRTDYYTLLIPATAILGIISIILLFFHLLAALALILLVFGGTLLYFSLKFKSFPKALPRWIARWVLIFPYSFGIIKGYFGD